MAYFIANPNVAFNIDDIDLNFYVRNYEDDTLYKGINYVIQNRTFPDVFEVSANASGQLFAIDFGGTGITQNFQGAITGGTVTGILEYSYNLGDGIWFIGDISVSAVSLYNAANTATNEDDLNLIQGTLGGNDNFQLSQFDDRVRTLGGDDVIYGGGGNDYIDAGAGNDTLAGNWGQDTLMGGLGNDFYWVQDDQDINDLFIENVNEGTDTVILYYQAPYTLGANIENLLMQTVGDASGTGNSLNNIISVGNGANSNFTLNGLGGDDTISGGTGNDLLDGGSGNDKLDGGAGDDTIIFDVLDDPAFVLGGAGTDTLTILSGDVPFSLNLSAHGFEIADKVQAVGNSTVHSLYNSSWQLTTRGTFNVNGSQLIEHFDVVQASPLSSEKLHYDELGRLFLWDRLFDDNRRIVSNYDVANSSTLLSEDLNYDNQSRLSLWTRTMDDNSRITVQYDPGNGTAFVTNTLYYNTSNSIVLWDTVFDNGERKITDYAANIESNYDAQSRLSSWTQFLGSNAKIVVSYDLDNHTAFSSDLVYYDAQGRLDLWDQNYDDTHRVIINYDQAAQTTFSSDLVYFDTQGRLDIWDQNYDNGSRVIINYDQAGQTAFSSDLIYYDNQGHLDRWDQNYDNGSRVVIDYDQANASSLANELLYFDNQGRTDLWDRNYDDGSRILVDFDQDDAQSWDQHVLTYNTQGTVTGDYFV